MACTSPSSLGGGGENFRKVFARGRSEMFFLMGGNIAGGRGNSVWGWGSCEFEVKIRIA